MIEFDAKDPFPLLKKEHSASYAEAQEHSEAVDNWLGLRTHQTEASLALKYVKDPSRQLWIGLPVMALLTPYTEIRAILEVLNLKPGDHVIDLGAGYGRMGFVLAKHFPEMRFTGYELVHERIEEGLRCMRANQDQFSAEAQTVLKVADLSDTAFRLERAECYFLYDFGTREAIEKTLSDLKEIARSKPIRVIGRGRASRDMIERQQPWLSQVVQARHYGGYSLYESG